jgi:DNA invertase Pin-like site-specific DNA recombinase
MTAIRIGYARCSTDKQDLTAQRRPFASSTSTPNGSTSTTASPAPTATPRPEPGPGRCPARRHPRRPKPDRLARSVPDARDIGDSLAARGVALALGRTLYDPADPMGKMFFNILATFAEFEVDLLRPRTREGMAIAKAKGKLRGKQPKLTTRQQAHLVQLHSAGEHTIAELAELFAVSRPTVYRVLERNRASTTST